MVAGRVDHALLTIQADVAYFSLLLLLRHHHLLIGVDLCSLLGKCFRLDWLLRETLLEELALLIEAQWSISLLLVNAKVIALLALRT